MQNSHMQNRGEYNPDAPEIWTPGGFGGPNRLMPNNPMIPFPRLPLGAGSASYRVNAPPFHGFAPNAGPPGNPSQVQRELISVPVVEANSGGDISATQKRRYEPEDTVAVADGPTKRKAPINSRLGKFGTDVFSFNIRIISERFLTIFRFPFFFVAFVNQDHQTAWACKTIVLWSYEKYRVA